MSSPPDTLQRITSLTPLDVILSRLSALALPVGIKTVAPHLAVGAIVAADVVAPSDAPPQALALHDGYAVASEQIHDASSYSPAVISSVPAWVNAGERMPAHTDAVLPVDAVTATGGSVEVSASVASGEGVLPARSDAATGMILRRAGDYMRPVDAAVLSALAVKTISVRAPRVKIISVSVSGPEDTIAAVIANAVRASGGIAEVMPSAKVEALLANPDYDVAIVIGGTGAGQNDRSVKSLARAGKVEFHGFGISPGQTAALGNVNGRIVLMLPGRLDAALSVFLAVGRPLMARLTGSNTNETTMPMPLTKKISSTIGFSEVVFLRRIAGGVEPLGSGVFSLQALLQADGWVLVPAASEGVAAGTIVEMRSLP